MSRLRVAIVATHPIQYQVPWFRALGQAGVDLEVLYGVLPSDAEQAAGFGGAFRWDVPLLEGYRWRLLPGARGVRRLEGFWKLRTVRVLDAFADSEPDCLVILGWNSVLYFKALSWAVLRGVPRIVRGDSNDKKRRSWWIRLGQRALLSAFDGALAVGRANRALYLACGFAPEAIATAGHFVDCASILARAAETEPRREQLRRDWSIPEDVFCFAFVGKLQEEKRPLDFVEALAGAARGGSRVHGLVVGAGALEGKVRARAETLGAPLTFAGFLNQSHVAEAYVAADALVLPSASETWGLVVNEAMLCGRPVIVSDAVGCAEDLVQPGRTGLVFPAGDVEALKTAMSEMAAHRNSWRQAAGAARARAAAFSPQFAADATAAVVEMACGRER